MIDAHRDAGAAGAIEEPAHAGAGAVLGAGRDAVLEVEHGDIARGRGLGEALRPVAGTEQQGGTKVVGFGDHGTHLSCAAWREISSR
jgi:hypothetical protein